MNMLSGAPRRLSLILLCGFMAACNSGYQLKVAELPERPAGASQETIQLLHRRGQCMARRRFLVKSEERLRILNAVLAGASGVLALSSGLAGIGAAAADSEGAKVGAAVTSGGTAVASIVTTVVRIFYYTDEHGYVRARANELSADSADIAKCATIESDLKLPAPSAREDDSVKETLDKRYGPMN